MTRYTEVAWAVVVRDKPEYPGDSMKEVIWDRADAERMRERGYFVYSLYVLEAAESAPIDT